MERLLFHNPGPTPLNATMFVFCSPLVKPVIGLAFAFSIR